MSNFYTQLFEKALGTQALNSELAQAKTINLAGLPIPLMATCADWFARKNNVPVLLIVPEIEFDKFRADLAATATARALCFPAWDVLPFEHKYPDAEIVAERILCLNDYMRLENPVVLTTARALFWRTLGVEELENSRFRVSKDMHISPESLAQKLVNAGYRREQLVEFVRDFARRGEIVDFFSPAHEDPVRVEFFGDDIDELRFFSTRDQRSVRKVKDALALPAVEWLTLENSSAEELLAHISQNLRYLLDDNELAELTARISLDRHFPGEIWFSPLFEPAPVLPLDFFAHKDFTLFAYQPELIEDEAKTFAETARELYLRASWENFRPLPPSTVFETAERICNYLANAKIAMRDIPLGENAIDFRARDIIEKESTADIFGQMAELLKAGKVYVAMFSEKQRERLESRLEGKLPVPVVDGAVSKSFSLPTSEGVISVLSADRLLGFSRAFYAPKRYHSGKATLSHFGLETGDFVVHSDYGIAKFAGISALSDKGATAEFLTLEFENGEKLYVPMHDFYLISPYIGPKESAKLAKLGTKKWSQAKLRAHSKIFELAGELVRIYATRQVKARDKFVEPNEWERAVVQSFPFEETTDQLTAIDDVFRDLSADHPMDRLLCGDVGFGKTEVALRAAMRVIGSGYQVAVLVPTTILAVQHYENFSARLAEIPITVEQLSRFTPDARVKEICDRITAGKIDLVIGTHRLLTDKIRFKNLGLLIVDEEQWFGVKHKEKLKAMRAEVDILTMTATPIPRTLYFSVAGLRDLSLIETPPQKRKSVFTQIVPWNMSVFMKAIFQEIDRGGQVFFVHNRVQTIDGIFAELKNAMPGVRFAMAHGQMPEAKLERVVLDFRAGKFDVLVSSAIIESGTDMPKVNTIIVDRADRFGLSQLYQLRGRVGRGDMQAYAYLVVPPYRAMTPAARLRLKAIMEHSELGSGYHLALKDLDIRGAGNLLGADQSGFVEEIGLDLYTKMLAEAVSELKGHPPPYFEPIPFSLDFDAYIPADYIPEPEERSGVYQRLFTADKSDKVKKLRDEISDRFGHLPDEASRLFDFIRVRIEATHRGFTAIAFARRFCTLNFDIAKIPLATLDAALKKFEPPLDFTIGESPAIRVPRTISPENDLSVLLRLLEKVPIPC